MRALLNEAIWKSGDSRVQSPITLFTQQVKKSWLLLWLFTDLRMLCSLCRSEHLNPSISVAKETIPQAIQIKQVAQKSFHLIMAVFIQAFKVRRLGSHKPRELGEGAQLLLLFPNSYPSYLFHQTQYDAGRAPHQHPAPLFKRPW